MVNFYRKFYSNLADTVQPLLQIMKPCRPTSRRLIWSHEATAAWKSLLQTINSRVRLELPDMTLPFILSCDASNTGIGAQLLQHLGDMERPIEFLSNALSSTEQRWPTHNKELYAIVRALKRWRHILIGSQVTIRTDHTPLLHLITQKHISDKQARWLMFMNQFNLQLEHVKGVDNIIADLISRQPKSRVMEINKIDVHTAFLDTLKDVCEKHRQSLAKHTVEWIEGLPYDLKGRIVIPNETEVKNLIINESHSPAVMGHLGTDRTIQRISANFYWTGLANDVRAFCQRCVTCQRSKSSNQKPIGLLHPIDNPEFPWIDINIDFLSLSKSKDSNNDNFMVVVDRASRRVRLIPCCQSIDSKTAAKLFFSEIVKIHGLPKSIISDRDPKFTSELWQNLFRSLGTTLKFTTAYHPQANGLVERTNRTIVQILRCLCCEYGEDWEEYIHCVEIAYNSSVHDSTGFSPMELDTGRTMKLTWDTLKQTVASSDAAHYTQKLIDASDRLKQAQSCQKTHADQRRRDVVFDVGQEVLLRTKDIRTATNPIWNKLSKPYAGPFKVTSVGSHDVYELDLGPQWKGCRKFHASRLKPTNATHHPEEKLYEIEGFSGYQVQEEQKWKSNGKDLPRKHRSHLA